MKKFLLVLSVMAFGLSSIAQQVPMTPTVPQKDEKMKAKESVEMKGGKVWSTKDGKSTIVNDQIIIGGTRVKADGSLLMKDGSVSTLKEGDYVNADGTVTRILDKKPEMYPK